MKITKNQLKRIIKEELVHFMDEKMEGAEELMEASRTFYVAASALATAPNCGRDQTANTSALLNIRPHRWSYRTGNPYHLGILLGTASIVITVVFARFMPLV